MLKRTDKKMDLSEALRQLRFAEIQHFVLPTLLAFAKDGFNGECFIDGFDTGTVREIIEKNFYNRFEDKEAAKKEFEDYINSFPEKYRDQVTS